MSAEKKTVTFLLNGTEKFVCDRTPLLRFDYFRALLDSQFRESRQTIVRINDVPIAEFKTLLQSITTGVRVSLTDTNISIFFSLADQYGIEPVCKEAIEYLLNNKETINQKNVLDILEKIGQRSTEITKRCVECIQSHSGYPRSHNNPPLAIFFSEAIQKNYLFSFKQIIQLNQQLSEPLKEFHEFNIVHPIFDHCKIPGEKNGYLRALFLACQYSGLEIIKNLLELVPQNSNFIDSRGRTPLHYLATRNDITIDYLRLFKNFKNIKDQSKDLPVPYGRQRSDIPPERLIEKTGNLPIHYAMQYSNIPVRELIEDAWLDNFVFGGEWMNAKKEIPLDFLARRGDKKTVQEVIELLLAKNPPVLLHLTYWTAIREYYDLFQYLVEKKGGSVTPVNPETGDTFLHWAAQKGRVAAADFLLKHGAHMEALNNKQQTPLHLAVINRHAEMVRFLLANKADPHAWDKEGKTPLQLISAFKEPRAKTDKKSDYKVQDDDSIEKSLDKSACRIS